METVGLHGMAGRLAAVAVVLGALAAMAVPMLAWLRERPLAERVGLLASGVVYVGSALGLEVLSRVLSKLEMEGHLLEAGLSAVEELGEMTGAALFATVVLLPFLRRR